jgi:hypothetical protein
MVNLEYTQLGIGVAISVGIQSGTQDNILGRTAFDHCGQLIFCIPAACGHESADLSRTRCFKPLQPQLQLLSRFVSNDCNCERIFKHARVIQ